MVDLDDIHWDNIDLNELTTMHTNITGTLTKLIDNYILNNPDQELRKYIGASSIGSPCERKIWYGYQGYPATPIEPKMQRTFDIGHSLEKLVLDYLEAAGCSMLRTPQHTYFKDDDIPQMQGHCDAIGFNTGGIDHTSIIEVKTARDSSFRVFAKSGLLKWYPVYYSQVQCYMGMSGYKDAFVIAINKDTSELHDEHVMFDPIHYDMLRDKALRLVSAATAPEKINNSPLYFVCRNCQYKEICHV